MGKQWANHEWYIAEYDKPPRFRITRMAEGNSNYTKKARLIRYAKLNFGILPWVNKRTAAPSAVKGDAK